MEAPRPSEFHGHAPGDAVTEKLIRITINVLWSATRRHFEVTGPGAATYGCSQDQFEAVAIAERAAERAEHNGHKAVICVGPRPHTLKS